VGTIKVKPFWILMKQETMGWQWHPLDYMQIICTTLQTNNHTTRPDSSIRYRRYINHLLTYLEPHHSVFCRPDTLPDAQPTVSKHRRPTDLEQVNRDNYADNQLIQIHLGKWSFYVWVCMHWIDNIKSWTGLSVEESIRMTEDRDKWRKYVHGVANPRIKDG